MDILQVYYYTSLPILTCNLLFYSVANLSTSITSSQNVIRFVSEHSHCDSIIFQNAINKSDLFIKLSIVKSLIYDTIKKYCNNDENKYNKIIKTLNNQELVTELEDYLLVDSFYKQEFSNTFENINEPIKLSIMVTSKVVFQITELFEKVKLKICDYNKTYKRHFYSLNLKNEINELDKLTKLLDLRLTMLIDLLKIYA